jgi:chromosome segregation ATPase
VDSPTISWPSTPKGRGRPSPLTLQNASVRSEAIAQEIKELEQELSALRARLDDDDSSFTSLEQQIAQLRQSLTQTQETVRMHELRLAEKQVALAEARRLERLDSYEDDLARYREVRSRVAGAAKAFLAEVESYDGEMSGLRKLLEEMRAAFGDDERVAKVEAVLAEEREQLNGSWEAVVEAAKWRIAPAEKEAVEEAEPAAKSSGDDLSDDLQKAAQERRTSRILDYFNKS